MAREEHRRAAQLLAAQLLAAQLLAAAEAIREAADSPMLAFNRAEYEAAVAMLSERLGAGTLGAT